MVFRVTQFQMDQQFIYRNQASRELEAQTLEKLSTLKKVNRASDDPEHYNRIRDTKTDLAQTEAFQDSIANTLNNFQLTEDALGGIRDVLDEARALVIRGTSHLHDPLERITIADQLAQMRLTVMNRLNTQSEGHYIFSGTDTDVEPFQDPVTGNYSGNNDAINVRISDSDTLQTNFPGDDIAFGPGGQGSADDILDMLQDLDTAFRTNNLVAINAEIPRLEPALERINQQVSEVGTRSQRLILEQTHYQAFETELQAVLAELEDADLAEEALNLEAVQNTLQAQLRSQGTINRQSLLDFIG